MLRVLERCGTAGLLLLGYHVAGSDPKLTVLLGAAAVFCVMPVVRERLAVFCGSRLSSLSALMCSAFVASWLLGPVMMLGLLLAAFAVALHRRIEVGGA